MERDTLVEVAFGVRDIDLANDRHVNLDGDLNAEVVEVVVDADLGGQKKLR